MNWSIWHLLLYVEIKAFFKSTTQQKKDNLYYMFLCYLISCILTTSLLFREANKTRLSRSTLEIMNATR